METNPFIERIPVWDRFVRIFHWSLAGCVLVNYFINDDGETLHQWLGYAASALVVARVVWGFIDTRYARLADFFPTPAHIKEHLQLLAARRDNAYPGHNPVGALLMLAMMILVVGLGITGHMQTLDSFWGEEWLQDLHETLGSALILCVGLHVAAGVAMSFFERTNLIKAMVTGVKIRHRPKN